MPRRACRLAILACALALSACDSRAAGRSAAATVATSADDLFGDRLIPRFELELTDEALESLRREPRTWVRGTFRYAGTSYEDVGVRLKGHRSRRGFDGKPAFKLRFDKFVPKRRFLGQRELVLNNLVEDPTMVREAIAYRLHRELGVPAPRTGWAQLVVNGEAYGLYLNVEAPDEELLERVFGKDNGEGSFYEGEYGCDLYVDDAPRFERDGGDDEQHGDLAALAELAERDPARLFDEEGPLDLARVVAFLAVSTVIGDFDGYRHSHNYRLYRNPADGRWSLMPWGLDRSLKRHMGLFDSGGRLARLCFADAGCRAAYALALARAAAAMEALAASGEVERWMTMADAGARGDGRKPYGKRETRAAREKLRQFLAERPGRVRAELPCLGDAPPASCTPLQPEPACEAVEAGGARFLLCQAAATWSEAQAHCAAAGLQLARIDGPEQNEALAKLARARSSERWWIGLADREAEGAPAWADGAPVGYAAWGKGQPDDAACGEDCAAIAVKRGSAWADSHCQLRKPFICR